MHVLPPSVTLILFDHTVRFLADRTIRRTYATVLRPSVCRETIRP